MDKYHPGYFGKVGMRYFHKQQNHFWKPVVNLDKVCKTPRLFCPAVKAFAPCRGSREWWLIDSQLWSLVPAEKREEYLQAKNTDTVPVIDLLPLGYSKVLGKGRLPNIPIVVRARWVSKLAEKKITEAGGVVELVA